MIYSTVSLSAREAFRQNPYKYNLMITDLNMPNLNGRDLLTQVQEIRADFPVIMITGYSDDIGDGFDDQLGIKRFLTKPLTQRDLATAIRGVLDETYVA